MVSTMVMVHKEQFKLEPIHLEIRLCNHLGKGIWINSGEGVFSFNHPSTKGTPPFPSIVTMERSSEVCLRKSSICWRLALFGEGSKVKEGITCKGEEGMEISHLLHLRRVIIWSSIFRNSFHRQASGSQNSFAILEQLPSLGHRY